MFDLTLNETWETSSPLPESYLLFANRAEMQIPEISHRICWSALDRLQAKLLSNGAGIVTIV
jgi:hypothetical protein